MDDKRNLHVETTPHPDGEYENVHNDATGKQMGIYIEDKTDPSGDEDPFHISQATNNKMKENELKKINDFIGGKPAKE
ncbi:hypothetical protein [Bacillus fonticola]|uniref:hypothetical protein n=1 Tax=Bacillus fonticola TaxID=2728853 RepID=UPI0014758C8F|nr:hypothetical protein [Bacillus fonticola]